MSLSHRMTGTRLYRIWKCMRTRCNNPNRKEYKNYGGRGVAVCKEWDDFSKFYEWSMENGYTDELTIDRINNDDGYYPENCRWATKQEQANNKQQTLYVFYKGGKYHPKELSEITGISFNTIYDAHKRGVSDFTNYKPQRAAERNIYKRKCGYEVNIKGKYLGQYKTIEEAIKVRDSAIKCGLTNT